MGDFLRHALGASARVWSANSIADWLTAGAVAIVTWSVLLLVRRVARSRLGRPSPTSRPFAVRLLAELVGSTRRYFLAAIAISLAQEGLGLPPALRDAIERAVLLLSLLQVGIWASRAVRFYLADGERDHATGRALTGSLGIIDFVGKILIWSLLVLLALDNLGVNITALLAGLGVGGVAVALALQNVLGDLFASLSIALDEPFVVGDVLTIDALTGKVERVGIKTTRLRADSGEQIVLSNADILKSRVRNFARAAEARTVATIRVAYDTPAETLREIPVLLEAIVRAQPHARFERCHLKGLEEWAVHFELAYFRVGPAENPLLDLQHSVNLAIVESFQRRGIRFAVPARRIVPGD